MLNCQLYMLKRQFGGPIVLFHLLDSDTAPQTGEATQTTEATPIARAIILPVELTREANKQSSYDTGTRTFIIDYRDAPDVAKDDWIVYGNGKYAIESVETYELAAWVVVGKQLIGEAGS